MFEGYLIELVGLEMKLLCCIDVPESVNIHVFFSVVGMYQSQYVKQLSYFSS